MSDDLSWDTSDIVTRTCDIATATTTADRVLLHFGTREADELQVQAYGARLLRQIALRPASARHLRDMLAQAVAPQAVAPRGVAPQGVAQHGGTP